MDWVLIDFISFIQSPLDLIDGNHDLSFSALDSRGMSTYVVCTTRYMMFPLKVLLSLIITIIITITTIITLTGFMKTVLNN